MKEQPLYSRRLAFTERMYLATLRSDGRGLTIQFAFHGPGSLDPKALEVALANAAVVHPGARLRLQGHLGWTRWVSDGPIPRLREIPRSEGVTCPEHEQNRLDPRTGPTVELLWIRGEPGCLIFRCLHSVMDGAGLLLFAEDVFKALRGEEPKGVNSSLCDSEFLIDTVGKKFRKTIPWNSPALFEAPQDSASTNHEVRVLKVLPKPSSNLVARLAVSLAKTWGNDQRLRFMVPSNARNYRREILSTANLSYPLFFELDAHANSEIVQKEIFQSLVKKDFLRLDPLELKGPWIPLIVLRLMLDAIYFMQRISRKGLCSIFISHIQFPQAKIFCSPAFETTRIEYIPAREFKFGTISIVSIVLGGVHDIVVFAPRNWAKLDDLRRVAEGIKGVLEEN